MSTAYTVATLTTAIKERIGYDGTSVIGDPEILVMINDVLQDVWDVLTQNDIVDTSGPLQITTVAGTIRYAVDEAVYRIRRVGLVCDGVSYPLDTFELGDSALGATGQSWGPGWLPRYRTNFLQTGAGAQILVNPAPDGAYTLDYWYIAQPPVLTGAEPAPNLLTQGLYPIGEYLILEVAIRCMRRLRRDAGELMADRDRYYQRLEQLGQPMQRDRAPMALRTKPITPYWGRRWR